MSGEATNPYRDAAATIELGRRVVDELMSREDWRHMLERFADQERLPYAMVWQAHPNGASRWPR